MTAMTVIVVMFMIITVVSKICSMHSTIAMFIVIVSTAAILIVTL